MGYLCGCRRTLQTPSMSHTGFAIVSAPTIVIEVIRKTELVNLAYCFAEGTSTPADFTATFLHRRLSSSSTFFFFFLNLCLLSFVAHHMVDMNVL